MAAIDDMVWETSADVGTGPYTLTTVVRSFNAAFGTGGTDTFNVYIYNADVTTEWLYGSGHLSDATTLVIDTIDDSSNGGSAVNFSAGTKNVTCDAKAAEIVRNGDTPQLDGIELGHPTDTTVERLAAGVVGVEGRGIGAWQFFSPTATTSGSSVTQTGIPAWATEVCIIFDGVGTTGTPNGYIRLGTSGGIESTGYAAQQGHDRASDGNFFFATSTTEFNVGNNFDEVYGRVDLALCEPSTNTWAESGNLSSTNGSRWNHSTGIKALSGALDRVELGIHANSFNAGQIIVGYR